MTQNTKTASENLGELFTLKISPWSLRARWALAYHNCQYTTTYCQPLVSTLYLWYRLNFPFDKITLPILLPSDNTTPPLRDSLLIAQYADKMRGDGVDSLFPESCLKEIDMWSKRMDVVMGYGRQRFMRKMIERDDTIMLYVPKNIRWIQRYGGVAFVRWLTENWFLKKYSDDGGGEENARIAWNKVRERIMEVKKERGGDGKQVYLIQGKFSYADILVAVGTMFLEPLKDKWFVGVSRAKDCARDERLGREFHEVISWRDEIFEKHFPEKLMPKYRRP